MGVINDHRWAFHGIADIKFTEQKHRCIIEPPNFIEVDAMPNLDLCLVIDKFLGDLSNFFINGLAKCVICFTDATDLSKFDVVVKSTRDLTHLEVIYHNPFLV